MPDTRPNTLDRQDEWLWSKLEKKSSGCIEWTGCTAQGYGIVRFAGKSWRAHRLVWHLTKGEIPEGLCVLHKCDNPPCCNVDHLWVGTHKENSRDMSNKERDDGGWGPGHLNGRAKLTWEKVHAIRASYAGGESISALARKYLVTRAAIRFIVLNLTWKDKVDHDRPSARAASKR